MFGSSIREDCNENSDTDLAVEYLDGVTVTDKNALQKALFLIFDECDLLEINDRLLGEIIYGDVKEGLIVYERPKR